MLTLITYLCGFHFWTQYVGENQQHAYTCSLLSIGNDWKLEAKFTEYPVAEVFSNDCVSTFFGDIDPRTDADCALIKVSYLFSPMLFFPDASKRHEKIPKACTRCLFTALVLPYNMASNTLSNHDRMTREVEYPRFILLLKTIEISNLRVDDSIRRLTRYYNIHIFTHSILLLSWLS